MSGKQDKLFAATLADRVDFCFDERVAEVFPDMIQRSVPGYGTLISMIGVLAGRYATAGSRCYDLGCSLGAVTLAMSQHIKYDDCRIIAVDNSTAMIAKASTVLQETPSKVATELVCANVQDLSIKNASVVVLNFTLQFIPLADRQQLLTRIYEGLRPGGILVLSEKLAGADASAESFLTAAHHDFKRANGYTDLEISQKRSALENVLIPESLPTHLSRLNKVGFSSCQQWFQCFNFASIVAIK